MDIKMLTSVFVHIWIIFIFLSTINARPQNDNSPFRDYLVELDNKLNTVIRLLSPSAQDRALPPLPYVDRQLPNVHPWRSIQDGGQIVPEELWQDYVLEKHHQQQQQQYTDNLLRSIEDDVSIIEQGVKNMYRNNGEDKWDERSVEVPPQQHPQTQQDIVAPDKPWRNAADTDTQELAQLLGDLDKTLKHVENVISDTRNPPPKPVTDNDNKEKPTESTTASTTTRETSTIDKGELELMTLLQNNNNNTNHNKTASQDDNIHNEANNSSQENSGVHQTLKRLMTDLSELERQVKNEQSAGLAQQLHDRIMLLAEKLGERQPRS